MEHKDPHPMMVEMICQIINRISYCGGLVLSGMGDGLREEHYQRGLAIELQRMLRSDGRLKPVVKVEYNIPVEHHGQECGFLRADIVVGITDGAYSFVPIAVVECKSVSSSGWEDAAKAQVEAYRLRLGCMFSATVNFPLGEDAETNMYFYKRQPPPMFTEDYVEPIVTYYWSLMHRLHPQLTGMNDDLFAIYGLPSS
jgi:hypothetical protein